MSARNRKIPADWRANLARLRQQDGQELLPARKEAISLRVDVDVLTWFRRTGRRYQTRMNAVLREYMQRYS